LWELLTGAAGTAHTSRKEKGWAWGVGAMITFGITALLGCGHDTHHYCPRCNKHLAFAKLM
jgi:hypothetical protein